MSGGDGVAVTPFWQSWGLENLGSGGWCTGLRSIITNKIQEFPLRFFHISYSQRQRERSEESAKVSPNTSLYLMVVLVSLWRTNRVILWGVCWQKEIGFSREVRMRRGGTSVLVFLINSAALTHSSRGMELFGTKKKTDTQFHSVHIFWTPIWAWEWYNISDWQDTIFQVHKNNLNPVWKPVELSISVLCNANHSRPLRLS